MRYTRPIVILTLILLLAGSFCFAQCGNKNYNSPYGINFHAPSGTELTTLINEVQESGIGWIRVDFDWIAIEPSQDNFSWSRHDAIIAAANARGILVFGSIGYSPAWATNGAVRVGHPKNPADWYDICYRAAERYDGKHGKGLVSYWGMWNEPNLADFYSGTRTQYINEILINGYNAVKAANPDAKVCGPELAHMKGSGRDWFTWMKDCIEQAGDYIDVLTHHTYGSSYSKIRDRMDKSTSFGSSPNMWGTFEPSVKEVLQYCNWFSTGKPVWHTEVGWQSWDVGEANQANYYDNYFNDWFTGKPNRSWIERVFFYEMFDHYAFPDLSWGIVSINNGGAVTRKPSFTAVKNFIAANPPAPIAP